MRYIQAFFQFLGRFCLATIFLIAGIGKIFTWDQTVQYMSAHGMPMAEFFIIGAILTEVIASFCLAFGIRAKLAAALLLVYLIPVTYIFHPFWLAQDPAIKEATLIEFLKNLAIFGGLLLYVTCPQQAQENKK
jgi:putative oxidoreductase